MKSFKMGGLLIAMLAAVGCTSAKVTEPSACDSESISFAIPNLPPVPTSSQSVTIPFVQTDTTVDLSSTFQKLNDIAKNVQTNVTQFSLTAPNNELGWVTRSFIYMQKGNDSSTSYPLGFISNGTFVLQADGGHVHDYFSSGPVTLTVTLGPSGGTVVDTSTLQMLQGLGGNVSASVDLCLSVSGDVSKSL